MDHLLVTNMCEAILQCHPNYFSDTREHFYYYTSEEHPHLPETNFAVGYHCRKLPDCNHKPEKTHFHVLIYSEKTFDHRSPNSILQCVPCPFSAFKLLILATGNHTMSGDIFVKLQTAVTYNEKYPSNESNLKSCRSRLPKPRTNISIATQTDMISTAALQRFHQAYFGAYAAEFNIILDSLISGYGSLNVNNHQVAIHFSLQHIPCFCCQCL